MGMSRFVQESGISSPSSGCTPNHIQQGQNEVMVPGSSMIISRARLHFEARRPQWLREMLAEFFGVFLYALPGTAATAAFVFAQLKQTSTQLTAATANFQAQVAGGMTEMAVTSGAPASNLAVLQKDAATKGFVAVLAAAAKSNAAIGGSFLSIGFAFALGITFAIILAARVSDGHFSPALTLLAVVFKKFPLFKAARYIVAQLLGGLLAALLVYGMFHHQFLALNTGPLASAPQAKHALIKIFCSLPDTDQSVVYLFLTEFVVDFFLGLVMMACMDQSNPFLSAPAAAICIGMTYGLAIWSFGSLNISLNTAKDLSGRVIAAIVVGRDAFTYKSASWVGTLVNIPAFFLASAVYDLVFRDSQKQVDLGFATVKSQSRPPMDFNINTNHKESV